MELAQEEKAEQALHLLNLPDDNLRAVARHLDVWSLLTMAFTCRSLYAVLSSDDVWRHSVEAWGGSCPEGQDAREYFAHSVYARRPLPLLGQPVSRYAWGGDYTCTVLSATLCKGGLELSVLARGDGTLGPLQSAENSSLRYSVAAEPALCWREPCAGFAPSVPPTQDTVDCTLTYRLLACNPMRLMAGETLQLGFAYGEPDAGGYETALLFSLDDSFIQAHHLGHLLFGRVRPRWL